jgi:hypothetical protein
MNKYLAIILMWAIVTGLGAYQRVANSAVIQGETMQTPNTSNGQIVLTDKECPSDKSARWAYTYNGNDGTLQEGCWNVLDQFIEVTWTGGAKKVYPPSIFRRVDTRK